MGPEETATRLMEEAKAQLADRPAVLLTLNLAMGAYGDAIRADVAAEREACERLAGTERDVRLESAARADDDSWAIIERLRAATADNIAAAIRARGDAT